MTTDVNQHFKVGVALSGGGARGFAHVGALMALEEYGLKPEVIAGVSAGAVIAVLYSAGVPYDEMLKAFASRKFHDFCEFRLKGGGFFRIDKFKHYVKKLIGSNYANIEDLKLPVHIGVTNLDAGCPEVFSQGPLLDAMLASCSIPILFQPVKINGVRYVDGGVLRNIPTWIIRKNCDFLVGVNCSPLGKDHCQKNTVFDVGIRSYALMSHGNNEHYMQLADLPVTINEISGHKTFSLKNIREICRRGYEDTVAALEAYIARNGSLSTDIHRPTNLKS